MGNKTLVHTLHQSKQTHWATHTHSHCRIYGVGRSVMTCLVFLMLCFSLFHIIHSLFTVLCWHTNFFSCFRYFTSCPSVFPALCDCPALIIFNSLSCVFSLCVPRSMSSVLLYWYFLFLLCLLLDLAFAYSLSDLRALISWLTTCVLNFTSKDCFRIKIPDFEVCYWVLLSITTPTVTSHKEKHDSPL